MSHPRRFLVLAQDFDSREITLKGPEGRHLVRVLRVRKGETVTLFDERGRERIATVTKVDRKSGTATLHPVGAPVGSPDTPTTFELHLAFAMLKGAKNDAVIRTATYLGVSGIHPFFASHTIPTVRSDRVERWTRITREAARQSSGLKPPEIHPVSLVQHVLPRFNNFENKIVFHERASTPVRNFPFSPGRCAVMVGPEGGFSDAEVESAESSGFYSLSLGGIVLRSELAVEAALIIALHRLGRLG